MLMFIVFSFNCSRLLSSQYYSRRICAAQINHWIGQKCKPLSFSPPPPQWRDQWGLTVSLLLFSEKTCLVALSSKSTVPWCSETWGRGSALTTRTTRWRSWLAEHTWARFRSEKRTALKNVCPSFRPSYPLQNSLTRSAPLNSDSQGRFGNRFLSSYDHRFVIKTVSSEDIAEMHNILKKYHQVEAALLRAIAV